MKNTAQTLSRGEKGFTLIELLVVIGILAILLAITLIAINPQRQFQQSNNTKRASDVNAILNAVNQYMADNKGALPAGINTTAQTVAATAFNSFCTAIVPLYIAALPVDPLLNNGTPIDATGCTGTTWSTGYTVQQISGSNRLTIAAPSAELNATIQVTR
jgi:prepilin-type N-terminal cleavage/methylation domain-containing protein